MIQKQRIIDNLIDLCRIQGEPREESLVAEYICDFFSSRGFLVERDSAHEKYCGSCGNIFVRIPEFTMP